MHDCAAVLAYDLTPPTCTSNLSDSLRASCCCSALKACVLLSWSSRCWQPVYTLFHASFLLLPSDTLLADIVSCWFRSIGLWPLGACMRAMWARLPACPAGLWSHCLGNSGACSGLMYLLKRRHCMPRWRLCSCIPVDVTSWQLLMRRAFERYLPALGSAVWRLPTHRAEAPIMHVGYWRAFSQLRPQRLLEPARVSTHQHLQERLASN
jgi:hypothetical protein